MKNILESAKDFKIIPNNFKSAGEFEVISVSDNDFKAKLSLLNDSEYADYKEGGSVEVFGVNDVGLLYFETSIIKNENKVLTLATTQDYSIIQRREYSRVKLNQGQLIFKDMPQGFVERIKDISAGGIRFICKEPVVIDKSYEVEIILSNNMTIECDIQPIRIKEYEGGYMVSAKFTNLENVDRVVLVQYAFKIKMEEQSKGN